MKLFIKATKYIAILVLIIILSATIYLYNSGPTLPPNTDDKIDEVLAKPLPDIIKGKTGIASSNGVDIWYESQIPKDSIKGTVILIMGISNDALGWPDAFIQSMLNAGYQVIRYDHRGTGLSDWMDDWDAQNPYSLSDMADDAIAVLDVLEVEQAHIIGVSMGGMIAQQLTIDHRDRVRSLTSIMSSGDIFDNTLPPISGDIAIELIKVGLKYGIVGTEKNLIKLHLASRMILMGDAKHDLNIKEIASQVLYNIRERKGYNMKASPQHQAAVQQSTPRNELLAKMNIPTLIIHGINDPFIPYEHGQRTARSLSNVDSLWVENMGHDLPNVLIPEITVKIIATFKE